jgi:hypothetical protein
MHECKWISFKRSTQYLYFLIRENITFLYRYLISLFYRYLISQLKARLEKRLYKTELKWMSYLWLEVCNNNLKIFVIYFKITKFRGTILTFHGTSVENPCSIYVQLLSHYLFQLQFSQLKFTFTAVSPEPWPQGLRRRSWNICCWDRVFESRWFICCVVLCQ